MVAILALVAPATACTGDFGESPPEPAPSWDFVTRPDLSPPLIDVSTSGPAGQEAVSDRDPMLLAPKGDEAPLTGLLIVDADGDPVWVSPLADNSYDFRVQRYRSEPVLTWWRGDSERGTGEGEFVIMDDSYQEIASVTTQGGAYADFHEMTLTAAGTALLVSYPIVGQDLTGVGGPRRGYVRDGVVQEVDVATGEVIFEWSAAEHVPVTETQVDLAEEENEKGSRAAPFDYFHINSVTEDDDGSLLISARHTHAVYRVDRVTGAVDWTLGGSASDFALADGAYFAWQHDAQRQPDGTITLFDNQSDSSRHPPATEDTSRGLKLALDPERATATVVQEFLPPDDRLSASQGNLQVRENGNVVIGWGSEPYYSEYAPDGELVVDAHLGGGDNYRAYRLPWRATPSEPPELAVTGEGAARVAHVSWNGATEVAAWRFLAGDDPDSAVAVTTVDRDGFETSAPVPDAGYLAAEALDASGRVLATAVGPG